MRMRSILMKLVLLATSLALGLVIIEVGLRTFAPLYTVGNIYWYQYDEDLGIRLRPGMHDFSTTDYQAEMRTNAYGTVNFQETFDDYDELVFTIGDSYTQGTGLPSDSAYPFQMDLMLNMDGDRYERRYGVVNLGLAGYGADQSLIALQRYAQIIGKPDYILFFGCSNDYRDDQLFASGYRHRHPISGNPHFAPFTNVLRWLTNEVQLIKRVKYMISPIRQKSAIKAKTQAEMEGTPLGGRKDKRNVALLQEPKFDRLLELAKEYDAELVVGWTDLEGTDNGDYNWLQAWAREHGVRFADWRPSVKSVVESIPALPTNSSHSAGHRRSWVNKMIARAYALQVAPGRVPAPTD